MASVDALVHLIQQQTATIEALTARGPLGFWQRRRLQRLRADGVLSRRIREDELRALNLVLKRQLRDSRLAVEALREDLRLLLGGLDDTT